MATNLAFGSVAKAHFTCPQQNFEKKMIKVIYTIIISFGILSEVFSDFGKKMFRLVETVIKCTEGKTSKNTHDKLVFRFSWTLTRKTCSFTGKFLAGLSKLLSTCPKEPLKSNISERKSWKLQDFRIIFEVFGTMAEKFYQGWQNRNRCPLEQYMKIFFKRETFAIFPDSEQFLSFQRKFLTDLWNPQSRYPWKVLRKIIFEIYMFFHTSLKFDRKKTLGR